MEQGATPEDMDLQMEYPEIGNLVAAYGPGRINISSVFPDRKGMGIKKHNNKKIEYLTLAKPVLDRMLRDGETLEYVGRAVYVSGLEQMFAGGYWTRFLNFTTIVLTDRRMLLINTDGKGKPKNMLWHQVRYDRLKKAKTGTFGYFNMKGQDGKTRNYRELDRRDRKRIKEMLDIKMSQPPMAAPETAADTGSFENLCTSCVNPVPKNQYKCSNCGTEFRTPKTAALRSLILPGLGDFYLGHKWLAVIEMIGSLVVYAVLIVQAATDPDPVMFIVLAVIITLVNGLDGIATYFIARKGLIPVEDKPAVTTG